MTYIILLILVQAIYSQKCITHDAREVQWYLLLNAPATVSRGYLYIDSNQESNFIKYQTASDVDGAPLSYTLSQINNIQNIQYVAWNDQLPNGTTSSVRAHSKSIIAFSNQSKNGFIITHSMPQYPVFNNTKVNPKISDSQRIYGQHVLCMSLNVENITSIINKINIIRPFIYASNFILPYSSSTNLFQYVELNTGNNQIKTIIKNGNVNGSIFQDGLTLMFVSDMIAQTWGRPIQDPWCGNQTLPLKSGNSEKIYFDDIFNWKRTQDHSKWSIPWLQGINYSCFGDMNRMQSQWRRGGSFYCINNSNLYLRVKKLISQINLCTKSIN